MTRALRRLYAAPAGDAYWRALEARVLEAVAAERAAAANAWWQPLARWARPGALAAALLLALAGAAVWRAREVREESAIRAAMLQSNAPAAQVAAVAGARPDNEAVLRDVLAPR
ncbi:MAG TPA: hypothetical protein VMT93_08145, partial [Gemmatimonadaceae bacterium]|nr:hypothetical protein [Gemmatimonadaceae bacterium]